MDKQVVNNPLNISRIRWSFRFQEGGPHWISATLPERLLSL